MHKTLFSCAVFVTSLLALSAAAHESVNVQIASLDKKIQKEPQNVTAYIERAVLLRREKQFPAALADLETAQKLAPNRREILLERGLTLAAKGDSKEAENLLSAYLASGLPSAEAFVMRGQIREKAQAYADARSDYAAAVSLEPTPDTFLARGRMDETLGHWDEAARGYEEGMRILSGAVVLRLALVRVEHHRGHYDRAITLIDEIIPKLPVKADWLLLRAEEHAAAGRVDKARQDREEALREADSRISSRPTDFARMARAKALKDLGRPDEALRELAIILEHAPKFDEARILQDELRASKTRKR